MILALYTENYQQFSNSLDITNELLLFIRTWETKIVYVYVYHAVSSVFFQVRRRNVEYKLRKTLFRTYSNFSTIIS